MNIKKAAEAIWVVLGGCGRLVTVDGITYLINEKTKKTFLIPEKVMDYMVEQKMIGRVQ